MIGRHGCHISKCSEIQRFPVTVLRYTSLKHTLLDFPQHECLPVVQAFPVSKCSESPQAVFLPNVQVHGTTSLLGTLIPFLLPWVYCAFWPWQWQAFFLVYLMCFWILLRRMASFFSQVSWWSSSSDMFSSAQVNMDMAMVVKAKVNLWHLSWRNSVQQCVGLHLACVIKHSL